MQVPLEESKKPPQVVELTPHAHPDSESKFPIDSTSSQAGLQFLLPQDEASIQIEECEEEDAPDLVKEELYKRFNRRIERIRRAHKRDFVSNVGNALSIVQDRLIVDILQKKTKLEILEQVIAPKPIPVDLAKMLTAYIDTSAEVVSREVLYGSTQVGAAGSTKLAKWEVEYDKLESKLKMLEARNDFERAVLDRESLRKISQLRQHQALRFSKKMREISEEHHQNRREVARKAIEKAEEEAKIEQEREEIAKLQKLEANRDRATSAISIMRIQRQERMRQRLEAFSRERSQPKEEPLYEKLTKQFERKEDMLYYDRGRTRHEIELFMHKKRLELHKNRNRMRLEEILEATSVLDETRATRNTRQRLPTIRESTAEGPRYRGRGLGGSLDLSVQHYARLPTVKYFDG